MSYTEEEIGLIDGLLQSYFVQRSVSEPIQKRYWNTHQHMVQKQIGHSDLVHIQEALSFLFPVFDGDRQTQKELGSVLAKTSALLRTAF